MLALLTYFHSKVNPDDKKLPKFTELPVVQAYVVDHDKFKVHFHMSFIDFMKIYFCLLLSTDAAPQFRYKLLFASLQLHSFILHIA